MCREIRLKLIKKQKNKTKQNKTKQKIMILIHKMLPAQNQQGLQKNYPLSTTNKNTAS